MRHQSIVFFKGIFFWFIIIQLIYSEKNNRKYFGICATILNVEKRRILANADDWCDVTLEALPLLFYIFFN